MCLDELTLSTYIDDELTPEECRTVEEHLEKCSACQRRLDELLEMRESVQSIDLHISDEQIKNSWNSFQDRIKKQADFAPQEKASFWNRKVPMPLFSGIAAILLVMVGITFSMAIQQNESSADIAFSQISDNQNFAISAPEQVASFSDTPSQEVVQSEISPVNNQPVLRSAPMPVMSTDGEESVQVAVVKESTPVVAPVVTQSMSTPASEALRVSSGGVERYLFSPIVTEELSASATVASEEDLCNMEIAALQKHGRARSFMGTMMKFMESTGNHSSGHSSTDNESAVDDSSIDVASEISLVDVINYLESLDILYKLWIPQDEELFRLVFSNGEDRLYTDIPKDYVITPVSE